MLKFKHKIRKDLQNGYRNTINLRPVKARKTLTRSRSRAIKNQARNRVS